MWSSTQYYRYTAICTSACRHLQRSTEGCLSRLMPTQMHSAAGSLAVHCTTSWLLMQRAQKPCLLQLVLLANGSMRLSFCVRVYVHTLFSCRNSAPNGLLFQALPIHRRKKHACTRYKQLSFVMCYTHGFGRSCSVSAFHGNIQLSKMRTPACRKLATD